MSANWTIDDRQADLYATAAEYVLGFLDPDQAESFRQADGHEALEREAAERAAALAAALTPVAPPVALKERFLTSIRETATHVQPSVGAVRVGEGNWLPSPVAGITYKPLYVDRATGLLTMLVRMEPGAAYPEHRHSQTEQCLILEGDVIQGDGIYGPGDFTWADAGSSHTGFRTEKGSLLLIIAAASKEEF